MLEDLPEQDSPDDSPGELHGEEACWIEVWETKERETKKGKNLVIRVGKPTFRPLDPPDPKDETRGHAQRERRNDPLDCPMHTTYGLRMATARSGKSQPGIFPMPINGARLPFTD